MQTTPHDDEQARKLKYAQFLRQPMVEGGMWLQPSDRTAPPIYVVHEAHIQRLSFDGWRPVIDPRIEQIAQMDADHARENEALMKRIAELEAQVTAKNETKNSAETEPQDPESEDAKRKTRRSKPE